jgi:hypothetical protein
VGSLAPSNPAPWQGISGAAVFEKAGALVGVIVVLIFDYVERTPRFIEILRQLDDLFDEPQNLRFVANCRHRCVGVADRRWNGPISFVSSVATAAQPACAAWNRRSRNPA